MTLWLEFFCISRNLTCLEALILTLNLSVDFRCGVHLDGKTKTSETANQRQDSPGLPCKFRCGKTYTSKRGWINTRLGNVNIMTMLCSGLLEKKAIQKLRNRLSLKKKRKTTTLYIQIPCLRSILEELEIFTQDSFWLKQ